MDFKKLEKYSKKYKNYTELRMQENRSTSIAIRQGDIVTNNQNSESGLSARVYKDGAWGFAANPLINDEIMEHLVKKATDNAQFLSKKASLEKHNLPSRKGKIHKDFTTSKKRYSQKELIEYLKEVDSYIEKKCSDVSARNTRISNLDMEKKIITSDGSDSYIMRPRSLVIISLTTVKDNQPIQLYDVYGGFGNFEDNFEDPSKLYSKIDKLYEDLMKKANGVYAKPGTHDCIMDADLAGILAHEAIGHTTEADMVQNGSVAADYLNKKVASELVSLVDFANKYEDDLCPVPVFIDDEGVKAEDAVIIKDGTLKGYMNNKESAALMNMKATGNARAYRFSDEPLIRMRNTAILPGKSKLEDMISSIDNGYYLVKPSNGQADSTSEFMFGIVKGYKIENGKITDAIKDTTISGVAFDVLQSISMVSSDMSWSAAGMCGKKQPIPVGMGGPAVKCKINIGGK